MIVKKNCQVGSTVADVKDANKRGPLIFAAREGNADLCKYLVEELMTDVNEKDEQEGNGWRNNDYTGKNEHLLKSGKIGMCSDPYCTTCLTYYYLKSRQKYSESSDIFDHKITQ